MTTLTALFPKIAVFLVATIVGGSIAYVATAALNRPEIAPTAGKAPDQVIAGGGNVAAFDLLDAQKAPTIIAGLAPADLALASSTLISDDPPPGTTPLGFPRVPPVSQFDGGPFQNANCTLAAGAMLARLGFGIVTSGSILRTLQADQVGGTDLHDLQAAMFHGYGVQFKAGSIKLPQLKSLLKAGYGAVLQGVYGNIPGSLRLQPSFTGPHAIYLDGYYPGDATTPEAYYVIDPIGRGKGYQGDWWPASIVDAFGLAFGHAGRVAAAWVFPPGGVPPEVTGPDVLPLPPPGGGGGPTTTPAPGETANPSASAAVGGDEPGDVETPPTLGEPPLVDPATVDDTILVPYLAVCVLQPVPAACPPGVDAVFDVPVPPVATTAGPTITLKFVDSDQPNAMLIGFTVDPGAPADVKFWPASGSPATVQGPTTMAGMEILGQPMIVAYLDVLAGTEYHFQIVASDGSHATTSPVGTFTTGPGVSAFDVALDSASAPTFKLESGISPYLHLAPDAFAAPLEKVADVQPAACLAHIEFGGSPYCMIDPVTAPAVGTCQKATVTYGLVGIDATGVLIRAFPTETGESESGPSLAGILEAEGPSGTGTVSVGCLASGLSYSIVLDAIGDDAGILASKEVTVP
jgi:hypothetical protein